MFSSLISETLASLQLSPPSQFQVGLFSPPLLLCSILCAVLAWSQSHSHLCRDSFINTQNTSIRAYLFSCFSLLNALLFPRLQTFNTACVCDAFDVVCLFECCWISVTQQLEGGAPLLSTSPDCREQRSSMRGRKRYSHKGSGKLSMLHPLWVFFFYFPPFVVASLLLYFFFLGNLSKSTKQIHQAIL